MIPKTIAFYFIISKPTNRLHLLEKMLQAEVIYYSVYKTTVAGEERMKIPLFDLTRQYEKIRPEVLESIDEVLKSGRVILGPHVEKLESEISKYLGIEYALGVSSGTDALVIAVKALGIGPGDLVITTPYTFFATASCVVRNGAIPIFLDVDEKSYNLDLDEVELLLAGVYRGSFEGCEVENSKDLNRKIETVKRVMEIYGLSTCSRIKAMIPVHLFGRTMPLDRLRKIKDEYRIKIIEDCAQSIGSQWFMDGKVVHSGSIGDISILSFFPTKNLGAYGDGGMIMTGNAELYQRCRKLRVHGAEKKYFYDEIGFNARLDEIQAAILGVKFRHLDEWTYQRKKIADLYEKLLRVLPGIRRLPNVEWRNNVKYHVYHQYVVEFETSEIREKVMKVFQEKGIGFSVYYPLPLHLQRCFEYLGYRKGDLPVSERLSATTLALPIFPEMRDEEVIEVANTIGEVVR